MGSLVYNFGITDKSIEKNYIYKDINLDVAKTLDNRDIKESLDIDAIQNGIRNIFLFAKGERILLPEFGFNLYKYLYEPINDFTAQKLGEELLRTLEKWEPRITIQKLYIDPDEEQNQFNIEILYSIPSLDSDNILSFNSAINVRR